MEVQKASVHVFRGVCVPPLGSVWVLNIHVGTCYAITAGGISPSWQVFDQVAVLAVGNGGAQVTLH